MAKSIYNKVFILFISLVFINDLALAQNVNHWEMGITAADTWSYFPGTSEPPANWNTLNFSAATWNKGPGGFGYGDGDDATIIAQLPSVYLRKIFNVVDVSKIAQVILDIDYDDAFIAYLNGNEIARANIEGEKPPYSAFASSFSEAQMYAGGVAPRFILDENTMQSYLTNGDNILAIQVHNYSANSSDMSSNAFLFFGISDNSKSYRDVPTWFLAPISYASNLPLFLFDTKGQEIPDEPKITASLKIVDHPEGQMNNSTDEATSQYNYVGIETRGQSSQYFFPKKSYGIELRDELGEGINDSLLGMPEEEDWILYAPYSDKTMLRNAITYHLGSEMGTWQPRFKFCEVYINEDYQGVYLLIEKIKRDKNRVDISKLKPDEISDDNLTGGYIVKVDKIQDLDWTEYFYTRPTNLYHDARNYAFTYVYPDFDDIVSEQKDYLKNYLTTFENTLNGYSFKDVENGYAKYIDVNSFIDFQIMNELSNNVDGYRYSTYFYKNKDSKGGKLVAGPLWDFNLGYGNVDYSAMNLATDQWLYPNYGAGDWLPMHWWARLMEDPAYQEALFQRWTELRSGPFSKDNIMNYIDEMTTHLGESIDRNFEKWPIIGEYIWPNFDYDNTSYDDEIYFLKRWLIYRIDWMDNNITSTTGLFETTKEDSSLALYPNPATDFIYISTSIRLKQVEVFTITGQKLKTVDFNLEKIHIADLPSGIYVISALSHSGEVFNAKFFKK